MKFCERCGEEIGTRDGENRCGKCEDMKPGKLRRDAAKRQRLEREAVLRSCGLVKVRGALGGVYWE